MIDTYICYWSTLFIDNSIICQNAGKDYFSLHYLKNVLIRSLFLFLSFLLEGFG